MKDYSELKIAAEQATQGLRVVTREWSDDDFEYQEEIFTVWSECETLEINIDGSSVGKDKADAEFIAAANPAAVLELISEVEALRKEMESLNPFKFDTNKTTIGYTGCVICGQYTNHGGLQCPKLVCHSLSMENQRIVPVEQSRNYHTLESVISKVYKK